MKLLMDPKVIRMIPTVLNITVANKYMNILQMHYKRYLITQTILLPLIHKYSHKSIQN